MLLQGDPHWVHVSAVRADPRLAALWGLWVEDATGTVVRGHPGSVGDLRGANVSDPEARGQVWAEDGMVLAVVVTTSVDGTQAQDRDGVLGQVVDNLRVGTWQEFEALDEEIRTRPPTRIEPGCPSDRGFVSGVEGASRWVFQLEQDTLSSTGEWTVCRFDLTALNAGGGSVTPPPVGELAADGSGSGIVGGVAPPGTTRITVTAAAGRTVEAVLGDDGPRAGERVWGAFIPEQVPPPRGPLPFTVTAYDAAGAVLDSRTG